MKSQGAVVGMERPSVLGDIAANRPLLMSVLFAFGVAALAVISLTNIQNATLAVHVAHFVVNGLLAIAAPLALASVAPAQLKPRLFYALAIPGLFFGLNYLIPLYAPSALAAYLAPNALFAAAALSFWFILLKPAFGGVVRLAGAAPAAAFLGALGAAALGSVEAGTPAAVIGVVTIFSFAAACLVGVGVAADYAQIFAKGQSAHEAAAGAAHRGLATAAHGVLLVVILLSSHMLLLSPQSAWLTSALFASAAGALVAVAAGLFVTTGALSLHRTTDLAAVTENYRLRDFRDNWRPVRAALAPSASLAIAAMLAIAAVVALFEASGLATLKLAVAATAGLAAALSYVSMRGGIFVFVMLFLTAVLTDWGFAIAGVSGIGLAAQLLAITFAALLFGVLSLSWREARDVRRKPHEATERGMADGLHRYLFGAAIAVAALFIGGVTGLWPQAEGAAAYLGVLSVFGLLIAAPILTAMGAVLGGD